MGCGDEGSRDSTETYPETSQRIVVTGPLQVWEHEQLGRKFAFRHKGVQSECAGLAGRRWAGAAQTTVPEDSSPQMRSTWPKLWYTRRTGITKHDNTTVYSKYSFAPWTLGNARQCKGLAGPHQRGSFEQTP